MKKDRYRMGFHLMPPKGWLNDPNGLCQFRGEYHVFFQYMEEFPVEGEKCWGHYVSPDLLHWRFEGKAVRPDREYDRSGAYSGSALITAGTDGREKLRLYYTGNVKLDGEYDYIDSGREANVICLESGDGIHFSEKKLLLTSAEYPESYTCHVRDPKVWMEDETCFMVLGGRKRGRRNGQDDIGEKQKADRGAVLLYSSEDGFSWKLAGEITTKEPFGYMWECPDVFELDGSTCLSFCPQGLPKEDCRYQNGDQSGYVWLKDAGNDRIAETFTDWDMGFDFYAPQTFEDEKGRRILIGWAGLPEAPYGNPTADEGWMHSLTVPRVLTVQDGKICQSPAEELQKLRGDETTWTGDGTVETADFSFWLETEQIDSDDWELSVGEGMRLRWRDQVFSLEFFSDWGCGRTIRRMKLSKLQDIQILCDRSILEVFVNGGSAVMCSRFYPSGSQGEQTKIRVRGCGEHAVTRFWMMEPMEVI